MKRHWSRAARVGCGLVGAGLAGLGGLTSAQAAVVRQTAILTKMQLVGTGAALTADYVDLFTDGDEDFTRALRLGYVKNREEFNDRLPGGLWVRNVNPALRMLKADARTEYAVVCLSDTPSLDSYRKVSAAVFVRAWAGTPPTGCWPGEPGAMLVNLLLDGTRVVRVEQQYTP